MRLRSNVAAVGAVVGVLLVVVIVTALIVRHRRAKRVVQNTFVPFQMNNPIATLRAPGAPAPAGGPVTPGTAWADPHYTDIDNPGTRPDYELALDSLSSNYDGVLTRPDGYLAPTQPKAPVYHVPMEDGSGDATYQDFAVAPAADYTVIGPAGQDTYAALSGQQVYAIPAEGGETYEVGERTTVKQAKGGGGEGGGGDGGGRQRR